MKVRIRHEDEIRGRYFCDIAPTQDAIAELISTLKSGNGLYFETEEVKSFEWQFCVDYEGAYCELVVS